MPRPRTVDDSVVFAAAATVMSRDGPAKLTLARIAKVAGLSASTLVQRYGSKQGLLRSMSRASKGGSEGFAAGLRITGRTALEVAREFVLCFAGLAPTAEALVNNTLVYLQVDLADPVMRRNLVAMQQDQEAVLAGLLQEAADRGELVSAARPKALAKILPRLATGSLLAWALHRGGTARECLGRDVDAVLDAFRAR